MIKFFRIYVAAAYVCNGQDIVQNWISRLIDPTADVTSSIPLRAGGGHAQPESSQPQSLVGPTSVTLALVNQTASQKRIQVTYPATQAGMSHTPTWTVRCCSKSLSLDHLHTLIARSGWGREGNWHRQKSEGC